MSKYIKYEEAIAEIKTIIWNADMDMSETARVYEELEHLPTILPTIEVSEDCISREWVLEEYQKGKEKISKTEYFDELMWLVKHAPNVVPTYQPITIKADEKDLEPLKKQLKDIKTIGTLMTEEE